ncbi:hypothetical protein CBR_g6626 [Chara braunii]|uniref:Uncharacterized protein n=1 Tax=Chara braunii TaxID=69332 RepID=A0A388KKD9_CHABU|nr:hypothetical protein CBR_g6626 [Chara braunii]|eukprot:GBG70497.1 hypothetical protein CBR_g6626 [Chara braunii]
MIDWITRKTAEAGEMAAAEVEMVVAGQMAAEAGEMATVPKEMVVAQWKMAKAAEKIATACNYMAEEVTSKATGGDESSGKNGDGRGGDGNGSGDGCSKGGWRWGRWRRLWARWWHGDITEMVVAPPSPLSPRSSPPLSLPTSSPLLSPSSLPPPSPQHCQNFCCLHCHLSLHHCLPMRSHHFPCLHYLPPVTISTFAAVTGEMVAAGEMDEVGGGDGAVALGKWH